MSAKRVAAESPWTRRLSALVTALARGQAADYVRANIESVRRTLGGLGPDSNRVDDTAGARVVVNLSSAHVPAFCEATISGDPAPYKNCYDLERARMLELSAKRVTVDNALPLDGGLAPSAIYFGAVELNGTGIRFYGDVCLVLKLEYVAPQNPTVLDRNSYDVLRSPAREQVEADSQEDKSAARKRLLREWSGKWNSDLGDIASIKALQTMVVRERRWTAGQISDAMRSDEDYIEVLLPRSFGTSELQEARFAVGEAAADALTISRVARRPRPRLEALIWLDRRRRAEVALRRAGVTTRIVTSSGRTRA